MIVEITQTDIDVADALNSSDSARFRSPCSIAYARTVKSRSEPYPECMIHYAMMYFEANSRGETTMTQTFEVPSV